MRKLLIIIVGTLVLLALGGTALAQDTGPNCGDLSDSDCALLAASGEAMAGVSAANFHVDTSIDIDNLTGTQTMTLRLVGDGSFIADPDKTSILFGGGAEPGADLGQLLATALQNIWMDLSVIIELPRTVADGLSTGSMRFPDRMTTEIRIVDGYIYLNMDKLAALDPTGDTEPGWYGLDFATLFNLALMSQPGMTDALTIPEVSAAAVARDFSGLARVEDTQISEQTIANFHEELLFSEMLSDATARQNAVDALYNLLVNEGFLSTYTRSDLQQAAENYVDTLNGLSLTLQEGVGETDHYIHQLDIDIYWQPDTAAMINLFSSPDPLGMAQATFDFHIHFGLGLSRHNNVTPIPAPENPTIIPFSDLLNGL